MKIFCAVYTYKGNGDQIKALVETWGRRYDGFMAVSNHTDHEWGVVNMPHYGGVWGSTVGRGECNCPNCKRIFLFNHSRVKYSVNSTNFEV